MKITLRQKIYILASAFACVVLLLVAFIVWPLYTNIQDASYQLAEVKSERATLDEENTAIESFRENQSQYQQNLTKLDQEFVDPNNPVDLILFLENASDTASLTSKVSLLQGQQQGQQQEQASLTFQISCVGSLANTLQFLSTIENGPYLIEVETVNIQPPASQNSLSTSKQLPTSDIQADFLVKTFAKQQSS